MAECYLLQLSGQGLNLFLVRLLSLVSLERAGQRLEYALGTRVTYPGRITLSVTSSQYYSHSCLITYLKYEGFSFENISKNVDLAFDANSAASLHCTFFPF